MTGEGDGRPHSTEQVVATLLAVVRQAPGLRWIHGQGSSSAGFSAEADIDCVAVWDGLPSEATLRSTWSASIQRSGDVILEQAVVGGREVDLLHVPRALFAGWVERVDEATGWQDHGWPSPLYSVSGLAHGVVLHDPDGLATPLQVRLREPSEALRTSTRDALATALPEYAAELDACARRRDHWLHQHLAGRLLETTYIAWFVAEGHLPPFPKRLAQWFDVLGLDPRLVQLEHDHWGATSLVARTSTLEALCRAVLDFGQRDDD